MGVVAHEGSLAPAAVRQPGRGWVGAVVAVDPDVVGGQFARALEAIVCRCVHPGAEAHPCAHCTERLDRAQVRRLGHALFAGNGIPLGRRAVTEGEYAEVGSLLEQVQRLAAGKPPRNR